MQNSSKMNCLKTKTKDKHYKASRTLRVQMANRELGESVKNSVITDELFFCCGLDIRVVKHMRGDMLVYGC